MADEEVLVFPSNWQALVLFRQMQRQWRVGFNGPTGLCYEALSFLFDLHQIAADQRLELFEDLYVMEGAALEVINESKSG